MALTKQLNQLKGSGSAASQWLSWPLAISCCLALLLLDIEYRTLIMAAMQDAYFSVTIYVAGTLLVFNLLKATDTFDVGLFLQKNQAAQVPCAALLGALPGCGGAILITTLFVDKRVSFGALIAALTSTMGDASFLLIAKEPRTGLIIMIVSILAGTLIGSISDKVLKSTTSANPNNEVTADPTHKPTSKNHSISQNKFHGMQMARLLFYGLLGIVLLFSFVTGFGGIELPAKLNAHYETIGLIAAILSIVCHIKYTDSQTDKPDNSTNSALTKTFQDTNLVTFWVVLGFCVYEIFAHATGFDGSNLSTQWKLVLPFTAIMIGFLPGCGPQIVITSLYLSGSLPLSAQLGNAISNDGDALFPALAMAPKAAFLATLISAIPAVIIAYGYLFLFE